MKESGLIFAFNALGLWHIVAGSQVFFTYKTGDWLMRRLAVFILLFCIIAMPLGNAKYMYSLEEGKACIEEYSLNRFLQYPSLNFSNSTREKNISSTTNRNYSHHHVILLNSLFNNDSDLFSCTIDLTSKITHHPSKSWNASFAVNSSLYIHSHKLPPPMPPQNRILLI